MKRTLRSTLCGAFGLLLSYLFVVPLSADEFLATDFWKPLPYRNSVSFQFQSQTSSSDSTSRQRQNGNSYSADFPREFRRIDGVGNHLDDPELGAAETPFLRSIPADYADGLSVPSGGNRPSARKVSNAVVTQSAPIPNAGGASDYLWQWGQFLDHDIDESPGADPVEAFNIAVPKGDRFFDPTGTGTEKIEMNRTGFEFDENGVRQQINFITSVIDASNVYGSDEERATALRENDGSGKLKTTDSVHGPLLPYNTEGLPNAGGTGANLYLAGDVRANEQVALTSIHTLFVREHNHWAEVIGERDDSLTGDEIYEMARVIVAGEIQAITYREFLPLLLGYNALPPYSGYDSGVNPSISNLFAGAAYRVGHTMLSPELQRVGPGGDQHAEGPLPLKDAFFRPSKIQDDGIAPYLAGLATQSAQKTDTRVIDAVRNFLFGAPGGGGFDLASLNIQRGRDHGIPTYNAMRRAFGLDALYDFSDYPEVEEGLADQLAELYDSVEDIDPWVGLLGERHLEGALVGETLHAILLDQFTRLRDGDRFWYENYLGSKLRKLVEEQTLAVVIRRNTEIEQIQDNVFRVRTEGEAHVGLALHFPFATDEGETANDASGNGHEGFLTAGATWNTGGVETDGKDGYVRVDHASELDLGNDHSNFTVSFRAKLLEGPTGEYRALAKKGDGWDERAFALYLSPDSNHVHFAISTTDSFNESDSTYGALELDTWAHIALVKDGSQLKLFLNGTLDYSFALSGQSIGNEGAIYLGAGPGDSDSSAAQFADFRIHSVALNDLQIADLAETQPDPDPDPQPDPEPDPEPTPGGRSVSYLSLDENEGAAAIDHSLNGNDGWLEAGATWSDGKLGYAVRTDGAEGHLTLPHTTTLDLGGSDRDFSVSFWTKLDQGATGEWRGLAKKGDNWDERAFALYLPPDSNHLNFAISTVNGFNESDQASEPLEVGEWTHIGLSKSGTTYSLYLNGNLDTVIELTGPSTGNEGGIHFGAAPGDSNPVQATFDEIRVYAEALGRDDFASLARGEALHPSSEEDANFADHSYPAEIQNIFGPLGDLFQQTISSHVSPAFQSGQSASYTFILPLPETLTGIGDGHGTLAVGADGAGELWLRMGDGSELRQDVVLSEGGLVIAAYSDSNGDLLRGKLNWDEDHEVSDLSGNLEWEIEGESEPIAMAVIGSLYEAKSLAEHLQQPSAQIALLSDSIDEEFAVRIEDNALDSATHTFDATFDSETGEVEGTLELDGKTLSLTGTFFPRQSIIAGWFYDGEDEMGQLQLFIQ